MGKIGRKALRNLYILTMTMTMTVQTITRITGSMAPWYYMYFHCIIWIFLYLILRNQRNGKIGNSSVIQSQYIVMRVFLTPYVIFFVFTILGWLVYIEDISLHNITRAVSNNLSFLIIFFSAIATTTIFREKLIDYTLIAMSISYLFTIVASIVRYGIANFIETGLLPFGEVASTWVKGGNAANLMEVHDLTFAVGFYLIYYLMWNRDRQRRNWKRIVWCIVLIYLGYKRIQLAALLLIVIAAIFITNRSKKGLAYWSMVCTIGVLIVMYAYICFIDSGFLPKLAELLNINFSGRLKTYDAMSHYIVFSPLYIGRGMGAGGLLNADEIAAGMVIVGGHSDILFNYIDFGFLGFTLWIVYCFGFATNYIRRWGSLDTARLWLLFTIYAFIIYLTDNTFRYFNFQTCYMLIIFHMLYSDQRTNLQKSNR